MILFVITSLFVCQILGDPIPVENPQDTVNSPPNTTPWLASIRCGNIHVCAGSILSTSIVLTTAHCVNNTAKGLSVQVGSSKASVGASGHKVALIKCYGDCKDSLPDDVALLKVTPPFEFGSDVAPIGLADTATADKQKSPLTEISIMKTSTDNLSAAPMDIVMSAAGWMPLSNKRGYELRTTRMRILPDINCQVLISSKNFGKFYIPLKLNEICVAGDEGEICKGYSGGPLVTNNLQVGLIPWITDCYNSLDSKIYVDIPYYYPWIKKYSQLLESTNEKSNWFETYILPAFWPIVL